MKPLSAPRRYPKLSKPMIGLVLIATLIGAIVTAVSKNHIITALRSGETRTVRFAGDYFLLERSSNVKVAGVDAGVVKSVEEASDGSAVVEVKITDEVVDRVGSAPSARLRPTTLLDRKSVV